MSFFNRIHATQGLETLAAACGLFAFLATAEALVASGAAARPIALLIAGAVALSAGAGVASGRVLIAVRALLVGPFIACVLLTFTIPFTGTSVSAYAGNAFCVSAAFAAGASALFVAIRALRNA